VSCAITHSHRFVLFQVAARLIAHAGSLTNLAKYPASTVQILGAEKALFR
jgi:nucleolar protein 56